MKRLLAIVLSLTMLLGMFPVNTSAMEALDGLVSEEAGVETPVPVETESAQEQPEMQEEDLVMVTGTAEAEPLLLDGQELTTKDRYNGYVDSLFYGKPSTPFGTGSNSAGAKLTGDMAKIYQAALPFLKEIADGNRASTEISFGPADADVPMTFIGTYTDIEIQAVFRQLSNALRYDLPYDLYWSDGRIGYSVTFSSTRGIRECSLRIFPNPQLKGTEALSVDTAKTSAAKAAQGNAKAIVSKYAGQLAHKQLLGYKDEICALNTYNHAAADDDDYSSRDYGPWQLVYVFDKDPSTNVVCGGYAKAFQYLCDMGGFTCYYILGYTSGYHAWNIVTLENKNYLVDATNSDEGTWGQDGSLFLAGGSGSPTTGYTFTNSYGNKLKYTYEVDKYHDMMTTWGEKVLTLSSASYRICNHVYTSTVTKQPTEYATGTRTYTCSYCGDSYTETIAALPHTTHKYTTKVTAPTCTEQGYTTYTCPCGYSYKGNYVEAKGHTSVKDEAVEATCKKTGLTEGSHCSVCKLVLTAQKITPIADHKFVNKRCKWCGLIGGRCGTNANWRLNETTGLLSITGTGAMETRFGDQPWTEFNASIKTAQVGEGITHVTYGAFHELTNLTSVTLPESVTELGDCLFKGCTALTAVNIPGKVTKLGNLIFEDCTSLTQFVIPDHITAIGGYAFDGCTGLTDLILPEGLTELGSGAFSGCTGLTEMTVPDGITALEEYLFFQCTGLKQVNLPENLGSIGTSAFNGCTALESLSLPEGLFTMDDSALSNCESLTNLVIPASVVSIGDSALSYCTRLETVRFRGDAPQIHKWAFTGTSVVACYPKDNATWTLEKRGQYNGTIVWMEDGTTISEYSGYCGDNLTWEYDPDTGTLTISGTGAMYNFNEGYYTEDYDYIPNSPWVSFAGLIKKVVIEDGCTRVGERAFQDCISLAQISLPETLESIGRYGFTGCERLTEVKLPNSLAEMEYSAFGFCGLLRKVTLPEGLTVLGPSVLEGCTSLKTITLPESLTTIDSLALARSGLEEITIPGNVTLIDYGAFTYCTSLKTVTFTKDAPVFGEEPFNRTELTAYYPRENTTWTKEVRQNYGGKITWVAKDCTHKPVAVPGLAPTCTTPGRTAGTACSLCGAAITGYKYLAPLGHLYGSYTFLADTRQHTHTCLTCQEPETRDCTFGQPTLYQVPTKTSQGTARYTCTECRGSYEDVFRGTYRISGKGRMETAFAAADMLKRTLGVDQFRTILIASGDNFADALAGSYLAAVTEAPILLSRGGHMDNLNYIQQNLAPGGIVYILGGTSAVPQAMEDLLIAYGVNYRRIKGSGRLDTNIEILKTAGIQGNEILVATGWNFADSLSASATGKPILMVNNTAKKLTDAQKAYLSGLGGGIQFTIIGGTGAVGREIAQELEAYGTVDRLSGGTRELTSVLVARRYFDQPHTAMLAYSRNFPDGLCGGPLAYACGAPLLLVNNGTELGAASYVQVKNIEAGYIMGGTAAVSNHSAGVVFGS